jgi:hypothetical protein
MEEIHTAKYCIYSGKASCSKEHKGFPSQPVNSEHPHKSKYEVDTSCYYDIEKYIETL